MINQDLIPDITKMAMDFLDKQLKRMGISQEEIAGFKNYVKCTIVENPSDFLPMTYEQGLYRFTMVKLEKGYRLNIKRI